MEETPPYNWVHEWHNGVSQTTLKSPPKDHLQTLKCFSSIQVGNSPEASLANTADTDILEYILVKLVTRIPVKARTFLVKVKVHRGEFLNEGSDDLTEAGHTLAKEGEGYRWKQRTTSLVFLYYDRISRQWKKAHGAGLFETQ